MVKYDIWWCQVEKIWSNKLANAAFTAALHEKLMKKGSKIKALVAHP